MSNFSKTDAAKHTNIVFPSPALEQEEFVVSFDPKSGKLEIVGTNLGIKETLPEFDFDVKIEVEIQPKFRSKEVDFMVKDGLGEVVINIAEDIIVIG